MQATPLAMALALLLASCGGGGGDGDFMLPAGAEFDATRSGRVLITTETRNECLEAGECGALTSGPCELGDGNRRGLAVYRLGTTGLLFRDPADPRPPAAPEQIIPTADNPRRVIAHPTDPTLLYVATRERIQVFRLSLAGTACIDQTLSEIEGDPNEDDDLDPIDLVIDPTVGEKGVLYVAGRGSDRLDAYTIAADGTLPEIPTSCAVGTNESAYTTVSLVSPGFIAVAGELRIEVFARQNGQFPPRMLDDGTTDATCITPQLVSTPVSSLGAAFITDSFFVTRSDAPLGRLFVSEEVSRKIFTFPIDAMGNLAEDEESETGRIGVPQFMLPVDRGGSSFIYTSVFNEGRVDVYRLENGLMPSTPFSRTEQDPHTLPVGLAIDGQEGPILYVANGGAGRVDGFRLQADGGIAALPATSTGEMAGPLGDPLDSFPNDVTILPLP